MYLGYAYGVLSNSMDSISIIVQAIEKALILDVIKEPFPLITRHTHPSLPLFRILLFRKCLFPIGGDQVYLIISQ